MRIPSNVQPLGAFQEDVISNLFPSWLPSYTMLSRVTFVTGSGFGKAGTNKERHLIKLSESFSKMERDLIEYKTISGKVNLFFLLSGRSV